MLNSNMRCFEISLQPHHLGFGIELNSNMRCFEICYLYYYFSFAFLLNSNMRCFEIFLCFHKLRSDTQLNKQLNNNMSCFEIPLRSGMNSLSPLVKQ